MRRWCLSRIFHFLSLLLLLFFLAHAIEVGPELLLGQGTGSLTFGILHFFKIIILMFFVVVPIAFILDGKQTNLILFFHFFGNNLEVILQKIDLLIPLHQSREKGTFLDIRRRHFIDNFYRKEMVAFCFDHPLLFFDHIYIIIEGLYRRRLLVVHTAQSELSRHCEMRQREQDGQLMQKFQTYIILLFLHPVELLQHYRRNFHHRTDTKFLQIFFRLRRYDLHFVLLAKDDLSQTGTSLHLFLRMEILKNCEENISHLFIRLAIHYIIPICIFYLFFTDFRIRLRDAFLQLQKIFIEFLPHRIVTNRVDDTLQKPKSLRTFMQRFHVLHIERIDTAKLQFQFDHPHVQIYCLQFTSLVIQLTFLIQLQDSLQLAICKLDVFARFRGLFLSGVATGNIIQYAKLKIKILLDCRLIDDPDSILIDLVRAVDLQELVEHRVQLFSITRVALHGVLEGGHYECDFPLQLTLLDPALPTLA